MTTQITQTGALDLTLSGTRAPVIDYPSNLGNHFVEVRITDDLSILVTSAADAQELKTRFAAAEFYLTDEPLLAPPVHGDEPVCGVRGPEGRFRCACHPGHPGDHVAWGSEAVNGRPFTWPQPFDEFHEYPAPAGDLDDAGDDITDALVPDVAQPADLDAWKANVQQHVECTVGARPGFARNPTTFRFEPTVVTP